MSIVILRGVDGVGGWKGIVAPPMARAVAGAARERVVEDMMITGPPGTKVCESIVYTVVVSAVIGVPWKVIIGGLVG